jgi:hypothetical protein
MSRAEPIDLDTIKFEEEEEDLYGEPIKSEEPDSDCREGTVPLKYMRTPTGKTAITTRRARSPNSTPRHRRNPQDVDLEDRVLMRLIDSGMAWP